MEPEKKSGIVAQLHADLLRLQRLCPSGNISLDSGLGAIRDALPNHSFPTGAIHEFLSSHNEDVAATSGFVGGLLSAITGPSGAVVWISASRKLFPPALKCLGIPPDRFIFLDVRNEKEVLWAMDEALKCGALSAVIGELKNISFTESRRLQLAVEHSKVTGFVLRHSFRNPNTTACVSRWRISSLPSETVDDLPGIGFPRWKVELLRIRNGKPGTWNIQWREGAFDLLEEPLTVTQERHLKAG